MLEKNFIEGYYSNFVDINGERRVGVLCILLTNGTYKVDGWQYDINGNEFVSWSSIMSSFDGTELKYLYLASFRDNTIEKYGYSALKFLREEPNLPPIAYRGTFSDIGDSKNIVTTFNGNRQDSNFIKKYLNNPRSAIRLLVNPRSAIRLLVEDDDEA